MMDTNEVKSEQPDDFYDSRLEPDVVINDDSDESNTSLSTNNSINCSQKKSNYKNTQNFQKMGGGNSIEDRLRFLKTDKLQKSYGLGAPFLGGVRDTGFLQQCPHCKKYFKRLESHVTTQHLREFPAKPYECQLCHKLFRSLSNLAVHERTHSGLKPYICTVCGKGFTQSGNLVHHSRIHTGLRPYKCPICDRAFTQPGNLQNHVRLHNQEKPFQCHICERSFTQSSNLNSHLRNNHKELHNSGIIPPSLLAHDKNYAPIDQKPIISDSFNPIPPLPHPPMPPFLKNQQ